MNRPWILMLLVTFTACQSSPLSRHLAKIKELPPFQLEALDSSRKISSGDMIKSTPIIVMYFSPDCEHCQKMTKLMLDHQTALENTHIYMVTNESPGEAKNFSKVFKIADAKNVFIGTDYMFSCYRAFVPTELPYFAIYDGRGQLRRIYRGETDIHSIIHATQD